jgi:hypothetical protein
LFGKNNFDVDVVVVVDCFRVVSALIPPIK